MATYPSINIRAESNRHGLFLSLLGVADLLVLSLIDQALWLAAKLPLMLLTLIGLVMLLLGLTKAFQPKYNMVLTPKCLTFIHLKGQWSLPWHAITRIFAIKNTHGIVNEELAYIGLTLLDVNAIANNISPRLANHLIHEQKPILLYCLSRGLLSHDQAVINFEPFMVENNTIKGPIAAFLHQSHVLQQALGAHLFLAQTSLDRPLAEFVQLLNNCKASSDNYLTANKKAEKY